MARKRKAKDTATKVKRKYTRRKKVVRRRRQVRVVEGAVSRFDVVELKRQAGFDLAKEIEILSNKFKVQINGNLTIKDFPKKEANRTAQGYSRTADRKVYVVGCGYSA